jgi:predicted dehydrogenase
MGPDWPIVPTLKEFVTMESGKLSRRKFVAVAVANSCAAPLILSRRLPAQDATAANDRINLGVIGVGMQGRGHATSFAELADVQVVAVCDVEQTRRESAQRSVEERYAEATKSGSYRGCAVYTDFRDLLARPDIDAVVIATPDHAHAIPCLEAARAKKNIYCEKPLTLTIREGRLIADCVGANGVIFQTGSQQRSEFDGKFRRAVEVVRSGRLGTLTKITIGVGGPAVACDLPEEDPPTDVDWDKWLGPAAWRGYNRILCPQGNHRHFPAWRDYREFGGGGLADMGAHHFDIAQWALDMDESGPVRIEPSPGDATSGLKFVYKSGVEMFHGSPEGCTFEGTAGKLYVNRPVLESDPADILQEPFAEDAPRVYHATNHRRNWLECIRSREAPICPAEVGHRSATICHLANIAYRLRRQLDWDPEREQFVSDDEANALLSREPRPPWSYS